MLNFPVAMYVKEAILLILVIILLGFSSPVMAQTAAQETPESPVVSIDAPVPGGALQGVVEIRGTILVEGFQSVQISFAYQSDPTNTWFLIGQSDVPVEAAVLASWDTTTISDGNYHLRLQVFLTDGRVLESQVSGVRVRNYTTMETSTPAPVEPAKPDPTAQIQPTMTFTPLPDFQAPERTPAVKATNPAQVTWEHLRSSISQGVIVVVGVLCAAGLYAALRSLGKR